MISVSFLKFRYQVVGFNISGHSESRQNTSVSGRLVCAAVSSAAIMVANGISKILETEKYIQVTNGKLLVKIDLEYIIPCKALFDALFFHLKELSKDYPNNIKFCEKELSYSD
ncbi:MAG: ribosomal-processing cysteine protease Prp [Oscillospiraceae bacterium]|jgi:uncharacterized protein YsxB (DUF464 family)|nr:ribosomal-processing cysteine protease Prp [Oscillospiraceae bacterium]